MDLKTKIRLALLGFALIMQLANWFTTDLSELYAGNIAYVITLAVALWAVFDRNPDL